MMSTINAEQITNPVHENQPELPPSPSAAKPPFTTDALNSLLRARPSWSAQRIKSPKGDSMAVSGPPEGSQPLSAFNLENVQKLLSPESVSAMLTNPTSPSTAIGLHQLHELLDKDALRTRLKGAASQATTKTLMDMGASLDASTINNQLKETLNAYARAEAEKLANTQEDNLFKLITAFLNEDWTSSDQTIEQMGKTASAIGNHITYAKAAADALIKFGEALRKHNIDPTSGLPDASKTTEASAAKSNTDEPSPPARTFVFANTHESHIGAPREVMDFVHGTDKIDVSGIRALLGGKPLRRVDEFSGASGELQIHYLPATHSSVVAISGPAGTPPFVLKVFGDVQPGDLLT